MLYSYSQSWVRAEGGICRDPAQNKVYALIVEYTGEKGLSNNPQVVIHNGEARMGGPGFKV
jgi:hypothetical protein